VPNETQYSKPQLLREFRITDRTLASLETSDILNVTWIASNGLRKCSPDAKALQVLKCASNHAYSFTRGMEFSLLPFYRLLSLRFMQMSAEDLHYELIERNLIHSDRLSIELLSDMRDTFIGNIPTPLRNRVAKGLAPKTKIETQQLETLLRVCDVNLSYHNPDLEASFSFMSDPDMKTVMDSVLSTQGSFEDIRNFLSEALSFDISIQGLAFYQSMFHDLSPLGREDLKAYLRYLKPSARDHIRLAIGRTLEDYRVQSGLEDRVSIDATLKVIKDHTVKELIRATVIKTPDSAKDFTNHLRSLMLILDREDQHMRANTSDSEQRMINKVFSHLEMVEQPMSSEIFLIDPSEDSESPVPSNDESASV
jgi:hypothetical protein